MIAFTFDVKKTTPKTQFSGIFTQDAKNVVNIVFDNDLSPMNFRVDSVVRDPLSYIASKIQSKYPDVYRYVVDKNSTNKVEIIHSSEITEDNKESNIVNYHMISDGVFVTDDDLDSLVTINDKVMTFTLRDVSNIISTKSIPKNGKYTKNDIVNNILFANKIDYLDKSVVDFVHSVYHKVRSDLLVKDEVYVLFSQRNNKYTLVEKDKKIPRYQRIIRFSKDMYK